MDPIKHLVQLISLVLAKFGYSVAPSKGVKKCSQNQVTIEVTLTTAQRYLLNQYQRLNGTLLKQIVVPFDAANLTTSSTNLPIADNLAVANAYLSLLNTRSEKIVDTVPLLEFIRDNSFQPQKGLFNEEDIDWTKSYIEYPNAAIPTASTGEVVQLIIIYQDIPNPGYA